jgi:hypothetical protein
MKNVQAYHPAAVSMISLTAKPTVVSSLHHERIRR